MMYLKSGKAINLLIIAICLVFGHEMCLAQGGSTGSLAGTVADQQGAVVANAVIMVKSNQTGQEFSAVTSGNGTFNVPALGSGTYAVTVSARGFKQALVAGVKIDVGKVSNIGLTLEVGEAAETVTVAGAGGELLQTQSATVGATIVGRQIVEQPQASRDALDLVTLLPGVQTTGRPRTSTINGLPKSSINITLDGTDVQDNLISSQEGYFTFIRPRIDAIEEVTVSTAAPGADSSGDGAVQIKFVTRRGTNDYTGSLYWYHRNPSLNANYFFNNQTLAPDPRTGRAPRNRVLLNQYGGRAGGPLSVPGLFDGKDRAFFFVNYEEFRLPEQQLNNRTILSPEAQAGLFQYITSSGVRKVNLFDLAQANALPATVDPTIGKLLSDIRATTGRGTVAAIPNSPNYQQFSFVGVGGQDRYFTTVRLDFNLTSRHQLENVWNYQEFGSVTDFLNAADPSFPGFPNSASQNSQRWSYTAALRSTFTPGLVNEARFGAQGGISLFGGAGGASEFDNQGGYDLNLSDLGITDATAVSTAFGGNARGSRFFGPTANRRNTPVFNFSDTATWARGNHSLSFGGSYNLITSFIQDLNQLVPSVNFGLADGDPAENVFFNAANFPGASIADLGVAAQLYATLTGRVTAVDRSAYLNGGKYGLLGAQETRFRQPQFSLFAQDNWRVRPNLTLTPGLRWEPQFPAVARNTNFAKVSYPDLFGVSGEGNLFRPGTLTGRPTQFTQLGVNERLFDPDYNNFGPSVGVAWSPNGGGWLGGVLGGGGQTVLRGGYSLAFVREGLSTVISLVQSNPGGILTVNRDTADGTLPIGTLFRNRASLAAPAFPSSPVYPIEGQIFDSAFGFDPGLRTGAVHSFTFGVQRELARDMVFEARYVGTYGRNLWRRYGLNEINLIENGFLDEFKLAQNNLAANQSAGRGNTFAYFGPNTGTAPLPVMLAFFSGVAPSQAGNAAIYTSSQFTNATRLAALSRNNANPANLAGALNSLFLENGVAAGLPANFFVVNPGLRLGGPSLTTNDVDTSYDALQLELRRRFSKGLLLQASYTWSKSLSNFFAVSQTTFSQPLTLRPENDRLEHFRAPQDLQHAFKLNWIYELPVGQGRLLAGNARGIAERLIGGWEWHGTARWQSGRPVSFGNVQLVGMTARELQEAISIRKEPNGQVFYLPDDIILNTRRAFNVSATSATGYSALGAPTGSYIAPANSQGCVQAFTGQCGFSRLVLEGPSFTRFDLSVVKRIKFTEKANFEFRAEFLNAFNHINFLVGPSAGSDVATVSNFAAGAFGRVTSAYQDISTTNDPGGRLVQIVARINF